MPKSSLGKLASLIIFNLPASGTIGTNLKRIGSSRSHLDALQPYLYVLKNISCIILRYRQRAKLICLPVGAALYIHIFYAQMHNNRWEYKLKEA
jgi:hypothetical protein